MSSSSGSHSSLSVDHDCCLRSFRLVRLFRLRYSHKISLPTISTMVRIAPNDERWVDDKGDKFDWHTGDFDSELAIRVFTQKLQLPRASVANLFCHSLLVIHPRNRKLPQP